MIQPNPTYLSLTQMQTRKMSGLILVPISMPSLIPVLYYFLQLVLINNHATMTRGEMTCLAWDLSYGELDESRGVQLSPYTASTAQQHPDVNNTSRVTIMDPSQTPLQSHCNLDTIQHTDSVYELSTDKYGLNTKKCVSDIVGFIMVYLCHSIYGVLSGSVNFIEHTRKSNDDTYSRTYDTKSNFSNDILMTYIFRWPPHSVEIYMGGCTKGCCLSTLVQRRLNLRSYHVQVIVSLLLLLSFYIYSEQGKMVLMPGGHSPMLSLSPLWISWEGLSEVVLAFILLISSSTFRPAHPIGILHDCIYETIRAYLPHCIVCKCGYGLDTCVLMFISVNSLFDICDDQCHHYPSYISVRKIYISDRVHIRIMSYIIFDVTAESWLTKYFHVRKPKW